MAEDWTTLLTEKEQRRLVASSKYCHGRGLAHACCDELPGFLHSLAASRAVVEEQRQWLDQARGWAQFWESVFIYKEMATDKRQAEWREWRGRLVNAQLALNEADMRERLEEK